ncbi:hypothetical protein C8Q78DRAFT_136111 [Trametes maxima]|nr:hypothetical protein C8Q78DRAFT_136111 [Trametes maxima]
MALAIIWWTGALPSLWHRPLVRLAPCGLVVSVKSGRPDHLDCGNYFAQVHCSADAVKPSGLSSIFNLFLDASRWHNYGPSSMHSACSSPTSHTDSVAVFRQATLWSSTVSQPTKK